MANFPIIFWVDKRGQPKNEQTPYRTVLQAKQTREHSAERLAKNGTEAGTKMGKPIAEPVMMAVSNANVPVIILTVLVVTVVVPNRQVLTVAAMRNIEIVNHV